MGPSGYRPRLASMGAVLQTGLLAGLSIMWLCDERLAFRVFKDKVVYMLVIALCKEEALLSMRRSAIGRAVFSKHIKAEICEVARGGRTTAIYTKASRREVDNSI